MEGHNEPESGFEIDGARYPIPTFETFTMTEAQVLYDYSKLAVEDFAPADPDSSAEEQKAWEDEIIRKAKNPAFKTALAHIAYQRGNPDTSASVVKELVGKANMLGIALALADTAEGSDPTPSSPQEPERPPDTRTPERSSDSGALSGNGSDAPAEIPGPIGIGPSDTSPTSVPASSET